MQHNGREILSRGDIDERSERLLTYFKKPYFEKPRSTNLREIASFLTEKHQIEFNFQQSLGFNLDGIRILGAFNQKKKLILIDQAIEYLETKFNFTLAHELGHLALHRKITLTEESGEQQINDTAVHMTTGKRKMITERDWLEWQANTYAASILMPAKFVDQVLIAVKIKLGINLSRRRIFVDRQPVNISDFYNTITEMAMYFGVSRSAMEYRLRGLDLIEDHRSHPESVADILVELL